MAKTLNHDIAGLVRRCRRFCYEVQKSQSANVSAFKEADATRLRSYLQGLLAYKAWMQDQPLLDLPESSPREIDLGEAEILSAPDNEAVADLMNLFGVLEHELVNCQSSRNPCRLISHDEKRIDSVLAKMDRFLSDYIMHIQPLDLQESSPLAAHTGAGRTGLNMGS